MNVVWRARARRDLEAALNYIERESPSGARRIRSQILHSIEFLAEWSERLRRGMVFENSQCRTRATSMIHRVSAGLVVIHRVIHASRKR